MNFPFSTPSTFNFKSLLLRNIKVTEKPHQKHAFSVSSSKNMLLIKVGTPPLFRRHQQPPRWRCTLQSEGYVSLNMSFDDAKQRSWQFLTITIEQWFNFNVTTFFPRQLFSLAMSFFKREIGFNLSSSIFRRENIYCLPKSSNPW